MNSPRTRLRVLIVGAMCLLAIATVADDQAQRIAAENDLAVVEGERVAVAQPAAVTDIGTADGWCALRKPHTGDTIHYAEWFDMDPGVVTANCVATHGGVFHFYRVTVWADGHVQWTPLGPWWT